jgi:hypothetical protein
VCTQVDDGNEGAGEGHPPKPQLQNRRSERVFVPASVKHRTTTEYAKRLEADGGEASAGEVFVRLPSKHATHIGKVESVNERSKSVVVCKDFKMSSQNALVHPNGENYELYNLRSGPNHHVSTVVCFSMELPYLSLPCVHLNSTFFHLD